MAPVLTASMQQVQAPAAYTWAYTTCRPADADEVLCRHVLLPGVLSGRVPSFTSQCCRENMTDDFSAAIADQTTV